MPVSLGHDARLTYLWEDDGSGNINYAGTPTDSTNKTYGFNAQADSVEISNNPIELYDPNSAEQAEYLASNFSGSYSFSWTLSNPWFWKAVITEATSSGSSPTTHDFDGTPPWPMQVAIGDEAQSDERTLKGVLAGSTTLEIPENGEASVSMSGVFADESHADSISTSQVTESFDALEFSDGQLDTESTTRSLVQSVTVTIENNIGAVSELGSRVAVDYRYGPRIVTVDFGKIVENDNLLNQTYGGSSPTSPASRMDGDDEFSLTLTLDNGKSGSDQNKQTLLGTGGFPDTYSKSGAGDPSANWLEEHGLTIRDLDVEAVNASSSAS